MRIDKYICDTINITRTQVKQKISKGQVFVNGERVRSASLNVDENNCVVTLDGARLVYQKFIYIMMNKPRGVISASSDKKCTTAIDLLKHEDRRKDLFVAGRLDKDTTGFLILTNDGDFAHKILSPKSHVFKTYVAELEHDKMEGYEQLFEKGILIDDGYLCKSAIFKRIGERLCSLEICEGKFHQVKRMFEAIGNKVMSLKRVKVGGLSLDESLCEGEYRYLSDCEVEKIMNKIHKKTL